MKGEEAGGMTLQFLKWGRKGQCLEANLLVRVPNLSLTGDMRAALTKDNVMDLLSLLSLGDLLVFYSVPSFHSAKILSKKHLM